MLLKEKSRPGKMMAQCVKVFAAKSEDLSLITGTHITEGKN